MAARFECIFVRVKHCSICTPTRDVWASIGVWEVVIGIYIYHMLSIFFQCWQSYHTKVSMVLTWYTFRRKHYIISNHHYANFARPTSMCLNKWITRLRFQCEHAFGYINWVTHAVSRQVSRMLLWLSNLLSKVRIIQMIWIDLCKIFFLNCKRSQKCSTKLLYLFCRCIDHSPMVFCHNRSLALFT